MEHLYQHLERRVRNTGNSTTLGMLM